MTVIVEHPPEPEFPADASCPDCGAQVITAETRYRNELLVDPELCEGNLFMAWRGGTRPLVRALSVNGAGMHAEHVCVVERGAA